MNRVLVLAGAAGVVVVLAVATAVTTPGVLAEPDRFEEPSRLSVAEMPISADRVTGSSVTLTVETLVDHRGGPAENLTVRVRATDTATGLKAAEVTRRVGTVDDDGELSVPVELTVEREGGYRIDVAVFQDGERVTTASRTVEGVGSLQPAYARTNVSFRQFDRVEGVPSVEFSVVGAEDNRTTLAVSAYVTNRGETAASGLELVVKARQADSNIVADRAEILFEVRAIGADDPDAILAEIEAYARETLEPRMKAVRPEAGIAVETYAGFPGLDTDPAAEAVTLAKRLAGRNEHSKVAYGTEAGLFADIGGIPTVVVGPGDIAQAHQANEWVAASELEACGRFLERLLAEATRA